MEECRYFQFPLMLLKDLHINYEEAMEKIITYSIVDFALKQDISDENAAKQALYNYYRGGGLKKLYESIDSYVDQEMIDYDEDYEGFTGDSFYPEGGFDDIIKLFNTDKELLKLARINCQLSKINDFFGITGPDNERRLQKYYEINERVEEHQNKFGNDSRPTVEKNLFLDLKNNPEPIPILVSAYIAIRSLQGKKDFKETTKGEILMRMLGAKSNYVLLEHLKIKEINDIYQKYIRSENALRYHFDKLFKRLLDRKLLKSKIFESSVSRKIFLSTRIDYKDLANKIIEIKERRSHKKKEYEARQKIRNAEI